MEVTAMSGHDGRKRELVQQLTISADDFFARRIRRHGGSVSYDVYEVFRWFPGPSGSMARVTGMLLGHGVWICKETWGDTVAFTFGGKRGAEALSPENLSRALHERHGRRLFFGRCKACEDLTDIIGIVDAP